MTRYQQQLQHIIESGLQRNLQETLPIGNGYCQFNGKSMLNLSSNDYLGLNTDEVLKREFLQQLDPELAYFGGSSSSRLLTGNSPLYSQFDMAVSEWLGIENNKVLLYNSGYHANVGILPALCDKRDLILSDKLCHASIIDGIRLSSATHIRFRHNDFEQLEKILSKKRHEFHNVFIVTESLYSMDGDFTDIQRLVEIKKRFDAMIYLDEAHSIGVIGLSGQGLAQEQGVLDNIDIIVCPMGKAMASQGAIVIGTPTLHNILVNTSRTLLFTTALPPMSLAWSLFMVKNMRMFSCKRKRLQELQEIVNQRLSHYGLPTSESHIIPVIIGDNHSAMELSEHLRSNNILVFPIRPPTVAVNTARLRITLTADMSEYNVINVIDDIGCFMNRRAEGDRI